MKKLLIIHNIVSPYREHLFKELSKYFKVKVIYLKGIDKDRYWIQKSLQDNYVFCNPIKFSIFGRKLHLLNLKKYKIFDSILESDYILSFPTLEEYFPHLLIKNFCKTHNKKLFLVNSIYNEYNVFNSKISYYLVHLLYKKLIDYSKGYLCYGKKAAEYRYLLPVKKFYSIQANFYERDIFIKKEKKDDNWIIGTMCYLTQRKRVDLLIDYFYSFVNKYPFINIKLKIAGKGPEEENLKNLVKKYNIEKKVDFVGYVEGNEKINFLRKLDIFVTTSSKDAWGNVNIEAMSQGNILLISKESIASYDLKYKLFDNTFYHLDKNSFLKKLEAIIFDKNLFNKLLKENYLISDKYTFEYIAKSIFNFIEKDE